MYFRKLEDINMKIIEGFLYRQFFFQNFLRQSTLVGSFDSVEKIRFTKTNDSNLTRSLKISRQL